MRRELFGRVRGHGTSPSGDWVSYTEDDNGRRWAEPGDLSLPRADSPTSEPCKGPGVVPGWARDMDRKLPWEK